MSVTIHYSGKAKDWNSITEILNIAQMFAAQRDWMFAHYDDPMGLAEDLDKTDLSHLGDVRPFRGIILRIHKLCTPIRIDFNTSYELNASSTKTQFAPYECHAEIIQFFRDIEPHMEHFTVYDDLNLWDDNDHARAKAELAEHQKSNEALAHERPNTNMHGWVPGMPDPEDENEGL